MGGGVVVFAHPPIGVTCPPTACVWFYHPGSSHHRPTERQSNAKTSCQGEFDFLLLCVFTHLLIYWFASLLICSFTRLLIWPFSRPCVSDLGPVVCTGWDCDRARSSSHVQPIVIVNTIDIKAATRIQPYIYIWATRWKNTWWSGHRQALYNVLETRLFVIYQWFWQMFVLCKGTSSFLLSFLSFLSFLSLLPFVSRSSSHSLLSFMSVISCSSYHSRAQIIT